MSDLTTEQLVAYGTADEPGLLSCERLAQLLYQVIHRPPRA